MLTGSEILRRMSIDDIVIKPFDPSRINPNSYNISLNEKLKIYDNNLSKEEISHIFSCQIKLENGIKLTEAEEFLFETIKDRGVLDMKKPNNVKELIIPEEGMILLPNKLYLGMTNEYTETHTLIPKIDGRSSIGRLGISVHVTAGFGDIGFKGNWTLEITVVEPVVIYPNIEIGQLYYEIPNGEIASTYDGRYQNSTDVHESKLFQDY